MPERHVLIVGTPNEDTLPFVAGANLGPAIPNPRHWALRVARTDPLTAVRRVRNVLESGQEMVAALLPEVPSPERVWILIEWTNRLVVDRLLLDMLGDELSHWQAVQTVDQLGLVVLAPVRSARLAHAPGDFTRVEGATAFRDALRRPEPTVCRARVDAVLEDQERWFGDLSESRRGGAIALVMLASPADAPGAVDLCNPAGLGLSILDEDPHADPGILSRNGVVSVEAWGATLGGHGSEEALRRLRERCQAEAIDAALEPIRARNRGFVVMMLLTAPVDPGVRIPRGLVMAQKGLSGAQTLAVTTATPAVTVRPGQVVPIITPAWCLNRTLRSPDGEPVRPTPLLLIAPEGAGQQDVWNDLDARHEAAAR